MRLRPYQKQAVETIRKWETQRLLYVAPTGSGKTEVGRVVVQQETDLRVLWLAHRRELVIQAAEHIPGSAYIMPGEPRNSSARIQVGSIQTAVNELPDHIDLIVIDEAHRSEAATYQRILDTYPNAKVLGLTATPARTDHKGLGETYDKMILSPSPLELIEKGYLAKPRVFTHKNRPNMKGAGSDGRGDYAKKDVAERSKSILIGDIVKHYQKHSAGRSAILFAASVELSKKYTLEFNKVGIPTEHLDGTVPTKERDAMLFRHRDFYTHIICNYGVLGEGWDAPWARCAILCRPTKSLIVHLQQLGRIMRPFKEDKRDPIILDHAGNCLRNGLGLPEQTREWSLEEGVYRHNGPLCKECPECGATVLMGLMACTECTYEWPVAEKIDLPHVNGYLRELTIDERNKIAEKIVTRASSRGYNLDIKRVIGML